MSFMLSHLVRTTYAHCSTTALTGTRSLLKQPQLSFTTTPIARSTRSLSSTLHKQQGIPRSLLTQMSDTSQAVAVTPTTNISTAKRYSSATSMTGQNFSFNQTMMRIKDPKKSVEFYTKYFDMTLMDELHYPDAKFSLYFLITLLPGQTAPKPGTPEAKEFRAKGEYGCCLELTHNHGTEDDANFSYHNGNTDPRGFGHVGFLLDDVYAKTDEMLAAGVSFKKKPDDGNMKGLAFSIDPDGYWVEMIKRSESATAGKGMATFQQAMLRVKDPEKSLAFYRDLCGMTLVQKLDFPEWEFSLYFMATVDEALKAKLPEVGSKEATEFLWGWEGTTLELTHNYGTEKDDTTYHSGNTEPRGFGHVAFMVDDVYKTTDMLLAKDVKFQKKPDDGRMKGIAFALDPDGYWVELIKRNAVF
ncbi:hypothetical protein SARC_07171 [Sphaeroforma arctica JP610]|uniref:lactoylglutathione lyase n=1 Tax=Sphaeroforma arctica JP610 TaxID=667725 RepID=A0A0L0FWY2_9EUKA|nr:hypothetical protein SARC_07171 [Sphaeroforma arctica JP610]KNC80468.1 hypothetical protein SARC_07171 [Sphaeroforma arctica JP610]|eukprot:XP_014154370.1 hypothetical protein SARC_07171 [Sphaeroforma arctica JP610]